ncbi:uncharacterized protein K452DRAFT_121949 [Aplosporella prunicola CBS 121167]|uniref:Uncharacterized protein n=1 Tax=Aplosporella prunicola CBS 121167 TaxID=1176127 RepID=A0A6A6BN53_9PEZI|nr:uncharacterized protein K452DRAFT_121949 [Aplosporella prunicola CBS 121167]KAF2145560.1 hypothetical protein K452DRAFT_121949 [Aplosporella prunicola CBS 121167]
MPRKLPWLANDTSQSSSANAGRRPNQARPETLDRDDARTTPSRLRRVPDAVKNRADRTPSSSPPPQPPKQELMREGPDGDDMWIMVEDEFLDTAQMFTQHLHHAEYHRLKRLAKERSASAIQKIARPVVPHSQMSTEAKLKRKAEASAEKHADALRQIGAGVHDSRDGEDSEEEDAPWMRDSQLAGLMSGSQEQSSSQLARLTGTKSYTRAAAGYAVAKPSSSVLRSNSTTGPGTWNARSALSGLAQEIEKVVAEDDDSDDLDGTSLKITPKTLTKQHSATTTHPVHVQKTGIQPPPNRVPKPLPKVETVSASRSVRPNDVSRSRATISFSESSIDVETRTSRQTIPSSRLDPLNDLSKRSERQSSSTERMAKRKAVMSARREREKKKKSDSLDEIPTFMI